jgi:asparagine N-glycosylation enzyme membrane subunit Stt3
LERWRPAQSSRVRVYRAGLLAALAGASVMAFPEPREGLLRALEWISKSDRFAEMVSETQPLFAGFSRSSRQVAEYWAGYAGYLIPLVPLAFLWEARGRERKAPLLFLAAWSALSGALALHQLRYGNDFAAAGCVGLALIAATPGRLLTRAAPGAGRLAPISALLLGLFLLGPTLARAHAPALRRALAHLAGSRQPGDPSRWSVELSAQRFARSIREATPATAGFLEQGVHPAYGILTLPKLGHVIHYQAQRATPANNFGPYIGRENFEESRRFYLEIRSETEALSLLRELGARYVVTFATGGASVETVADHLHWYDGSARRDRAQLGHFRLVTEGPKDGLPIQMTLRGESQPGGAPYKLFEVVEGAQLDVAAQPGTEVRASVGVRTPTGRTLRYLARTRADASGVARLRLPYSTAGNGPVPALGPYRVETASRTLSVEVSESDLREGRLLRLGTPQERLP